MTLIVEEVPGVTVLPSVDLVALNEGFSEAFESFLYGARVIHFFVFFVVHNSLLSTPVFLGTNYYRSKNFPIKGTKDESAYSGFLFLSSARREERPCFFNLS